MTTLIAIPCLNMVHTEFMASLMGLLKVGECKTALTYSTLTYDARNTLANNAIDGGFDRVLWLDSDMTFAPDLMEKLANTMLVQDLDYVSGLYFMRKTPTKPVIFKSLIYEPQTEQVHMRAENYMDYPRDRVFEIEGSGFGGVLMNVSVLKKVREVYGLPFSPMMGFGEDISFCWRLKQLGIKMWCDSRVKLGHLATVEMKEAHYLAQLRAEGKM